MISFPPHLTLSLSEIWSTVTSSRNQHCKLVLSLYYVPLPSTSLKDGLFDPLTLTECSNQHRAVSHVAWHLPAVESGLHRPSRHWSFVGPLTVSSSALKAASQRHSYSSTWEEKPLCHPELSVLEAHHPLTSTMRPCMYILQVFMITTAEVFTITTAEMLKIAATLLLPARLLTSSSLLTFTIGGPCALNCARP
jgi:hypothetical protein